MVELTPLHAADLFFGIIQLVLAVQLVRGDGRKYPDRVVAATLFLLNGIIGIVIGIAASSPAAPEERYQWDERVIVPLDRPTNFLLLLLVPLYMRKDLREPGWPRWASRWFTIVVLAAVVNAAYLASTVLEARPLAYQLFTQTVPLFAAYAGLLVVCTFRFLRAGNGDAFWAFMLFGWGARPMQLAAIESIPTTYRHDQQGLSFWAALPAEALLAVTSIAVVVVLARATLRRGTPANRHPWVLAGLVAGGLLGAALYQIDSSVRSYQAAQILSLVVLRPVWVGYGYLRKGMLEILGVGAVIAACLMLAKGLIAPTVRTGFWEITSWDLLTLVLAGFFTVGAAYGWKNLQQRRRSRAPRSNELHLLQKLLEVFEQDPSRNVTAKELAEGLGIPQTNVTRDLLQIRERLAADLGTAKGPELLLRTKPRTGHAYLFRLTPVGADVARAKIQKLGGRPDQKPLI